VFFVADWNDSSPLHEFYICDVFTAHPLQGNQLGVFVDGTPFGEDEMQRLARELNFAETVFLLPPEQGGDVRVRIFTPASELPFAGHPLVGTAVVVAAARNVDSVTLEVPAGLIPLTIERPGFARMQQRFAAGAQPFERESELLAALGVSSSRLPVELYANGPRHVYVALADEDAVAALRPDVAALDAIDAAVNCFAGSGTSWKTRMFYPASGIVEDAATGSAAGPLAVHLARHGQIAFGDEIEIRQGSEIGRPSYLYARATGETTAEVGGSAVIVAHGQYRSELTAAAAM
jgi:trans-2,3-dihydro-3-hydroxyanthranilate isomerase